VLGAQREPGAEGELRRAAATGPPGVLAQALQHRGRERSRAGNVPYIPVPVGIGTVPNV
jgi:hypothetical protein